MMLSLDLYRKMPTLGRLLLVARALAAGEVPPGYEGSPQWLQEQGELVALASLGAVRDGCGETARDLLELRRLLAGMGVPCGNWAVTDGEIAKALQDHAEEEYRELVRSMSPERGWELLELLAGGFVPDPAKLPPGAVAAVVSLAVRHIRVGLRRPSAERRGEYLLRRLRAVLPGLDEAAREEFRRAGLPADEAGAAHAATVEEARWYWNRYRPRPPMDAFGVHPYAIPFRLVLAEGVVAAAEIGTTREAMSAQARAWAALHARRAEGGDFAAFDRLDAFARHTGLGYGDLGIDDERAAAWRTARARRQWARARAGSGRAALDVIAHCEDGHGAYDEVSGIPAGQARAVLQQAMASHVAVLLSEARSTGSAQRAERARDNLDFFLYFAGVLNDIARQAGHDPAVDTSQWEVSNRDEVDPLYAGSAERG